MHHTKDKLPVRLAVCRRCKASNVTLVKIPGIEENYYVCQDSTACAARQIRRTRGGHKTHQPKAILA